MNGVRLTQSRGSVIFSVKTLYLPESPLYQPLLDMCHKVEENAIKSYERMSYNCGLDLELFIPMLRMYELLGAELPVTVQELRGASSPAEKSEVFHKIWRFARNKNIIGDFKYDRIK